MGYDELAPRGEMVDCLGGARGVEEESDVDRPRGTVKVQSLVARMNAYETLCSVSHSFDPIFAVAKESPMKRTERLRNIVLQR